MARKLAFSNQNDKGFDVDVPTRVRYSTCQAAEKGAEGHFLIYLCILTECGNITSKTVGEGGSVIDISDQSV